MKYLLTIVILILGALLLFSCSTGSSGPGLVGNTGTNTTNGQNQSPTIITTSGDGAAAAALVLQSKELAVTSTTLFKNLGLIAQSQMASATTVTGSGSCSDYGTYSYNRIYNNTSGNYNVVISFSLCREAGFQYDGNYAAYGKPSQFTGRLGGLKIMNFKNNYTTLIGSLVGASVSYKMEGSGNAANATYTITANGSMQAFDYYSLGKHTMTFSNLKTDYVVSTDSTVNIQSSSITANGKYSVKHLTNTTSITYADFTVNIQKQTTTDIEDLGIIGRVITDRTPNSIFEGVFDIVTTVPIRTLSSPYPAKTTQGTFVINNAATVQYGAVNTIAVASLGDAPINYAKEFMLMKQSDLYAMEQQLPIVSGLTGTASGNIMSISALSTGSTTSDLNCYTDVHVKYYNAASLPMPPVVVPDNYLWIVHWNSNLNTCATTTVIPYQEATSSTGVTTDTCDVGLDINGAAQDIASGGVEHFLAAALPAGYYVLSIDNYSCPLTVTNAATLLVGDYLFGPYSCAYSSSDIDGSNPGAWCRLADVRVNLDRSIDVLAPNLALTPWH
jgi:hypothetical protein